MTRFRLFESSAAVVVMLVAGAPAHAGVLLAPHRAVYELKLRESRGSTQVDQVRGRIVYEFTGDSCGGYALNFRQVTEIGSDSGDTNVSDLRSETWEDGRARSFRFAARNYLNQKLDRDTDGRAERSPDAMKVTLSKPEKSSNSYDARTLFPTEHLMRIIEAGRRGDPLLEARVYDGSEAGDKTFDTLTVIGKPSDTPPADIEAPAKTSELASERHWPVTVSYFEKGKKADGEQTPDYEMSFDLYENGVSRALKIDYGEFVLDGELKELRFLKATDCGAKAAP
ncbi:MAG TPA: cell envelope integrity EipB family protein [Hansschlegelia sp.]